MSGHSHKKLRAAGLVVFRRIVEEYQYLLLQTSYGRHHWTPPKGHVDPGESDLETAFRETEEEAGLKKSDMKLLEFKKELHYDVQGRPKTVIYWLAELINKNADVKLSDEHQAFKWVTLEEAHKLAEHKETCELLIDSEDYLMKNYSKQG